jgi:hypothetical protein
MYFSYRGTHKFDDIITSASPESLKKIKELQTQIQPDEVCSVQFSSVRTLCITNTVTECTVAHCSKPLAHLTELEALTNFFCV